MAGESTNDEAKKYGFERAEMYEANLAGTMGAPYERHVFLCYKSHMSWPSRLESSDADPFPRLLNSAIKDRANDMILKTRLNICEEGGDLKLSGGDVLVFPDMVVYRGLKESEVDSFVDDVLVNGKPWGVQEKLTGSYVFVCAHNNRDQRCGVCGPILIDKFKEEIKTKDLKNQVFVTACSHVGQHKYAGNVIIFCAGPEGNVYGNWYGYVTPGDVLELLDTQIGKGETINRILRGQMGAPVIETKAEEVRLPNGTDLKINGKQPQEGDTAEKTESASGCCQGVDGFTCCRDETVEKKSTSKGDKGVPCWTKKLEQRYVLTTVAVAAVTVTVAVAYGFYRRAR